MATNIQEANLVVFKLTDELILKIACELFDNSGSVTAGCRCWRCLHDIEHYCVIIKRNLNVE